jgi:hypothetical protein
MKKSWLARISTGSHSSSLSDLPSTVFAVCGLRAKDVRRSNCWEPFEQRQNSKVRVGQRGVEGLDFLPFVAAGRAWVLGRLRQSPAFRRKRGLLGGRFCCFGAGLFFAGELGGEGLGQFGVVEQAGLVPSAEFPNAFAGAPAEVELEQKGADEGGVESVGDAARTFGQPVSAAQETFYPTEEVLHLLQVQSLSKGQRFL